MKQQKSHYFKWGLTVFLTVCAILAFYDTFYMNGTLQRYLGKLVTVLAPVLYGFAMAYLLAPIVNWIEGLICKGLKWLSLCEPCHAPKSRREAKLGQRRRTAAGQHPGDPHPGMM